MTYFVQEREKTELVGTDRWTDGRTDEPKDGNTKKKLVQRRKCYETSHFISIGGRQDLGVSSQHDFSMNQRLSTKLPSNKYN